MTTRLKTPRLKTHRLTTLRTTLTSVAVAALCLIGSSAASWSEEQSAEPAAVNHQVKVADIRANAPDFVGISGWLNSAPLSIASLRGKVVLVDFWTYGCINCVRTLPYVTQLYEKYKDRGLVVVGIHTPEFPFEHSTGNVQAALKRHGIHYPVAQDNNSATWDAYRNQYWPAQYIVDRSGKIVFTHAGEGQYDDIERTIQKLLSADS
jgi:thiol-disulfide isomerase/thioredoxin